MSEPSTELLRAAVPANVRAVCRTLARAGHQAVAVGGAVRDALLGRTPGDWDVATAALPDEVIALFPHVIPTGLQHGTVTIVTGRGEDTHVEVTTFRGEGEYTDARRPDSVTFGVPLVDDLARRDLRVNAMAYDVEADRLIDPYRGLDDLRARVLRAVGPTGDVYADAVARFREDGLRVMRAVRFAATLEFALDPDTARGIEPALGSLARVSRERVCEELRKILGARAPSRALAPARATGILRTIAPAVDAMVADDARAAAWLARIDALDRAATAVRLAAFFLDPAAAPAAALARDVEAATEQALRALKFSNEEIKLAAPLASSAGALRREAWTDAEVRGVLSALGRERVAPALALWAGTPLGARAAAVQGDPIVAGELAIAGSDLIAAGIPAGPRIGQLLRALLARVLADPALNTKPQLLAIARE